MAHIADILDGFNKLLGKTLAWLVIGMVLVQFAVVLMRYVFGVGSLWAQESIIYMHGTLFMLAAAYTLAMDGHVRVDIFYRTAAPKAKAWVNLFGSVVLLIPVSVMIVVASWTYVGNSWRIQEGSMEASGIQGVYLLKTAIPLFGALMTLQGLVIIIRSVMAIRGDERQLEALENG